MLQTYAWNLVNHTDSLVTLREKFRTKGIEDEDAKHLQWLLSQMRIWMQAHALDVSVDRLERILEFLDDTEVQTHLIVTNLLVLNEILADELKRRYFLYMPAEDAELYQRPTAMFPRTAVAFPSTHSMINGACQCYTLGQYTACVFHCMGILQAGLYAEANVLNVKLSRPLHLSEWHKIIDGIENSVAGMRDLKKTELTDGLLSFHSQAASQFRYFKDAWRNHVAHMRTDYDRDSAHSILIHTTQFMEHLSGQLEELPIPSLILDLPVLGGIR